MRVSLRTEKISKGRESFYLDVYVDQSEQYQKRLKMYLIPVKSPSDKAKNKEVRTLAEVVRNKYEMDLLNKKHGRYDEKGNEIESNEYYSDGSPRHTYTHKYDDKGKKIESKYNSSDDRYRDYRYSYKYEFDEMENWIKRIEFDGEVPISILEREYEYYN